MNTQLLALLRDIPAPERAAFAARCGTSYAHLRNVGYGQKTCGEKLAVQLEKITGGALSRREMRPNDWWEIWPELAEDSPTSKKVT